MMELLDIVDEYGVPTGEQIERSTAHELGLLHRTSHVWIVRYNENKLQMLLQKRSEDKDSYPGCYDISSAGHIPAGVDFVDSALRELKEELGCDAKPEELIYCGQRRFHFEAVFHGKLFCDNQVSNVYALWLDWESKQFTLQKEEVSEVKWFDFEECVRAVENDLIPNCIYVEELKMVEKTINSLSIPNAPVVRDEMSNREFDRMLQKGLEEAKADDSPSANEAFSKIRQEI